MVVIVGGLGPYEGSGEIWGVNGCYRTQPNLSRLYIMDQASDFDENFADDVDKLGVPVFCRGTLPVKLAKPYPLKEVIELGRPYFTSSIAYALAHAIYEERDVHLHRIYEIPWSVEYAIQKPCLDFWCGVAIGRGIKMTVSEHSMVGRANPWESSLYGYVTNRNETKDGIESRTMTALRAPRIWERLDPWVEAVEREYNLHQYQKETTAWPV